MPAELPLVSRSRTRRVVSASVVLGVAGAILAALVTGPSGLAMQLAILNPMQVNLSSGSLLLALVFAFVAGATMILTPCGYPLIFALTGASAKTASTRSWMHSLPPFSVGIVGAMALVGILVSLLGKFVLSTLLDADIFSRVALSALVYGGLGVVAIFIGLRSLGVTSLPSIPGLNAVNQLFSARASNVQGFDRRMFAFGALYGGGMAAGCPVPTYWALLFWVAITANPIFGALVLGVHALGYAAPVVIIGILSRMGISVIKSIPKRGQRLQMFVSAGMLTAGVYLVTIYIVIRLSIVFL